MPPSTGILDNFNRANESPIVGGWKGPIFSVDKPLVLESEALRAITSEWYDSYWATKATADQEWYFTVTTLPASRFHELYARLQNPGGSKPTAYVLSVSTAGSWKLYRVIEGKETEIGSGSKAVATGDRYWINVKGTTIKCIHERAGVETVVIEKTDTQVTGEGYGGVALQGTGSSGHTAVDDFGGGTLSTGTTYNDSAAGSLSFSGSGKESRLAGDAGSGSFTLGGSGSESSTRSSRGTGALALSGSGTEKHQASDSSSGSLGLGGAASETAVSTREGSGSLSLAGSGLEAAGAADTAMGSLVLDGIPAESACYLDLRIGELQFSGTGAAKAELTIYRPPSIASIEAASRAVLVEPHDALAMIDPMDLVASIEPCTMVVEVI